MEALLSFIKVTLAFIIDIGIDAIHGVTTFVINHWDTISTYSKYVWLQLNSALDFVANYVATIIV